MRVQVPGSTYGLRYSSGCRIRRLAADLGTDRVVVHERRERPDAQQRDRPVVAAPAVAAVPSMSATADCARSVSEPYSSQTCPFMWFECRARERYGADLGDRDRLLVAQKVLPQIRACRRPCAWKSVSRSTGRGWLEWQRAQSSANTTRAARHRARAELAIELRDELACASQAARPVELGGPRRSNRKSTMFVQAVLDRAEVRAVAPALADVERRLAEAALLRIGLAQVGEVVDPALLGARADVEVDALDRLARADAVLAALEDVVHLLASACARCPALAVAARLAPARTRRPRRPRTLSTCRHLRDLLRRRSAAAPG